MRCLLSALAISLFYLSSAGAAEPTACDKCAAWNAPQKPFRIYGNAYYVGPHGLSSVLITSDHGHILIDSALSQSASQIAAHIRELGFRVEDIKLILNSHVHFDHAGGIAALQKLSGAAIKASPASVPVLKSGGVGKSDPQYGTADPITPVDNVTAIADGETVRVGALALTAHFTPGHTPGGTTWTWDSCEGQHCLHMVYADSLTAVSGPDFYFTRHTEVINDFERSFAKVTVLPCDILISVHPEFSDLWKRLERREKGDADGLVNTDACRQYAESARRGYDNRVEAERKNP